MAKKPTKEQLSSWKLRLNGLLAKGELLEQMIASVDEERELLAAELKEYGLTTNED